MANEKESQKDKHNKPSSNANSQPMPDEYSNTANHKGAVDLGTDGTKPTASQQQGQGAWNAKDHNNRPGSKTGGGGGGQGSKNESGEND